MTKQEIIDLLNVELKRVRKDLAGARAATTHWKKSYQSIFESEGRARQDAYRLRSALLKIAQAPRNDLGAGAIAIAKEALK